MNEELDKLRQLEGTTDGRFKSVTLPILFNPKEGAAGLERALSALVQAGQHGHRHRARFIILSDRAIDKDHAPIPALLAVAAVHHHLIREGTRTQVSLVLETGEPREVHHFALLIGYGAGAINPYLAFETLDDMIRQGTSDHMSTTKRRSSNYVKAIDKGVLKVMSKMGISTVQSYCGAQIFEAIGLGKEIVDKYFTGTPSRISAASAWMRSLRKCWPAIAHAFPPRHVNGQTLDVGGQYQYRKEGEYHLFNPETVHKLQYACRTQQLQGLQGIQQAHRRPVEAALHPARPDRAQARREPVPIEEVEPVETIMKRFKTGAMSYGSISQEAHETLAIAMNRIGGKSNTGEGGEDPERYKPLSNGDSKNSAIKQVASGRFGVTSEYLVNARELQIKMAQGAKPGEGGQLPGHKVYPWIAKVRHSTPGVGLISPPPHHDIYSIEDLAELIHDLKNGNEHARISVKLVAEVGVGTVAAGVAKAHADVVLISGHDGGTGASPLTSIKHAGAPWELGLAETQQTLLLNDLRSRIVVEVDGQLKTGRDVVIGALLGAEEFGFATAPLVALGCIMMRVCHLNTCPVGVATQDPKLRKKFAGDPQHVVNFMRFIAEEVREWMAQLGFRTVNEMIGRSDKILVNQAIDLYKAGGLDLSPIFYQPNVAPTVGRYCQKAQDHGLDKSLDKTTLLRTVQAGPGARREGVGDVADPQRQPRRRHHHRQRIDARATAPQGLPDDTIRLHFKGSAGQSFGAFVPHGHDPDARRRRQRLRAARACRAARSSSIRRRVRRSSPSENVIIGNVAFYGATAGEAYIRGMAGERFCVRNSGVNAVVDVGRRSRLRIHDRRPGRRARADGQELRRRHVGRHRLCPRRGRQLPQELQHGDGQTLQTRRRRGSGGSPRHDSQARGVHEERPVAGWYWRCGTRCCRSSSRSTRTTTAACSRRRTR